MQVDTVGTTFEKAKATEMFESTVTYYVPDGDDLLLSTKPIMKSRKKTVRYQRQ